MQRNVLGDAHNTHVYLNVIMVISDAINSIKADYNEYDDSISDKSENYNPVGPIFLKRHMLSLHSSSHLDSSPIDLRAFCLRKRVEWTDF